MKELKVYSEDEIRSHSSMLTNARLDILFKEIDRSKLEAWRNICVPNIRDYFSALYTLYDNIFSVFDENENREIKNLFHSYLNLEFSMLNKSNQNIRTCYRMLFILDRINRLIKAFMQKRQYFFKLGKTDIKGIERSLEVIDRGGGIFG